MVKLNKAKIEVTVTRNYFVLHPKYKEEPDFENDIALIKFKRKPIFNKYKAYVKPIVLIPSNFEDEDIQNKKTFISGMGIYDEGRSLGNVKCHLMPFLLFPDQLGSNYLLYTRVQITGNSQCDRVYKNFEANNLCVIGYQGSINNICEGDSGGPLVILSGGVWYQVGIVSFGVNDNCMKGRPTGFVRVASYLNWIKKNLG